MASTNVASISCGDSHDADAKIFVAKQKFFKSIQAAEMKLELQHIKINSRCLCLFCCTCFQSQDVKCEQYSKISNEIKADIHDFARALPDASLIKALEKQNDDSYGLQSGRETIRLQDGYEYCIGFVKLAKKIVQKKISVTERSQFAEEVKSVSKK